MRFHHVPTLDSLRALAVALVFAWHLTSRPFAIFQSHAAGWLGVDVFFVLSGFLITCLLVDELTLTGEIRLKKFWARRVLRIFPAYYTLLLVVVLVHGSSAVPGVLVSAAYLADIWAAHWPTTLSQYHLTHGWSLSIEEQFYLLWPPVLLLAGASRALRVCLAALVGVLGWRAVNVLALDATADVLYNRPDVRFDAILVGCTVGVLWMRPAGRRWFERVLASRKTALGIALAFLVGLWALPVPWSTGGTRVALWLVLLPAFHWASAFVVLALTVHARTAWAQPLRHPLLSHLGRMSYSIYLWHVPIIGWCAAAIDNRYVVDAVAIVLSLLAAEASHRFVEQPFLKLKGRFAVKSPAARPPAVEAVASAA